MMIAGFLVFYFVAFLLTGGSKILSAIISVAVLLGFLGFIKEKEPYNLRKHEHSRGVLCFSADLYKNVDDLYKRKVSTRYYTINQEGNIVESYGASDKALKESKLTYTLTNLVYFGEEKEPCGFQIDVTRRKDGKKESWRFYYPATNAHNTTNIHLEPCNSFDDIIKIYNVKNEKTASRISEKAFRMDVVK